MPVVITLLYGISVLLIYKNIQWIGEYLFEIEKEFINGLEYRKDIVFGFGWENYFNDRNRTERAILLTGRGYFGFCKLQIKSQSSLKLIPLLLDRTLAA